MTITNCRSCGSESLREVLDLGDQYLSAFYAEAHRRPPKHPLKLVVCESCTLAQLADTAPADELYTDTYSFKSGINEAIRRDLADVAADAYVHQPGALMWADLASNDGSLLACVPQHIWRVGVDPLWQFAEEASTHADQIIVDFFRPEHFAGRKFDVITSVSMFYDLDDPNEFVAGVASVLEDDGLWLIQQNYLPTMLANTAVDNLSHEHLTYFSLTSLQPLLKRHGLEVVRVSLNPINGGCFRTLIRKRGKYGADISVDRMLKAEATAGIGVDGDFSAFDTFAKTSQAAIDNLRACVETIVEEVGQRVFIYGASTRGAVLWQAAGITRELVPYAVERNPDKVGRWFSAVDIPIISEEEMRENPPGYLLIGPYWLREGITQRERAYMEQGGSLIFPLPELDIVGA